MERCRRRLKFGVGLVGFSEDFLGFITAEALFSRELQGFELGVGSTRLHHFITNS